MYFTFLLTVCVGVVMSEGECCHGDRMPLERLQRVFDAADCTELHTVSATVSPAQVPGFLREVDPSTQRLSLHITPAGRDRKSQLINLMAITRLTSLTGLWIAPHRLRHTARFYPVYIQFPTDSSVRHVTDYRHLIVLIRLLHMFSYNCSHYSNNYSLTF